jgi:hypothetical protein
MRFGRREYPMLPTFGVLEEFEDRCGSIAAHYGALAALTATLEARAFLVWLALKAGAAGEQTDDREGEFTLDAVRTALFERGLWHASTVAAETELIERLMWTPEQFLEKKAERARVAEDEAALATLLGLGASSSSSPSPAATSDGSPTPSGEQLPASSGPSPAGESSRPTSSDGDTPA